MAWSAAGGGVALLLLRCSPAAGYPLCPFRAATGWLCPGCGGTHALLALLDADLGGAFASNALVTLLVPLAAWLAGRALWRSAQAQEPWPTLRPGMLAAALLVVGVFTIWRNT